VLVTALSVYGAVNTPQQALAQLSDIATAAAGARGGRRRTSSRRSRPPRRRCSPGAASPRCCSRCGRDGGHDVAHRRPDADLPRGRHPARCASAPAWRCCSCSGGRLVVGAVIAGLGVLSRALADAPRRRAGSAGRPRLGGPGAAHGGVLAVLYRVAPDRRRARWHWISGVR
jgi:membrane protein